MTPIEDITAARQAAARIAALTDIRGVRLLKSSAEIVSLSGEQPFLAFDLNSDAAVEYDPGGDSFVVRSTYRLSITSSPTVDGDKLSGLISDVARIEFEHAALFVINMEGQEPPRPEELDAYAVTTGQFALYPYAREYISDLTTRLGLPTLTVGVLRHPVYRSDKEES